MLLLTGKCLESEVPVVFPSFSGILFHGVVAPNKGALMANLGGHFPATFSAYFAVVTFAWWESGKCAIFSWCSFGRLSLLLASGFNCTTSTDVTSEMGVHNEWEEEETGKKWGSMFSRVRTIRASIKSSYGSSLKDRYVAITSARKSSAHSTE